ncbi:MAG: DUF1667 domain-containing protein [Eubacteriales bacterium]
MNQTKKMNVICTVCPRGCNITVEYSGKEIVSVIGNGCARGYKYASAEAVAPERILTSTAALKSESLSRLPVRSEKPIPKDKMFDILAEIRRVKLEAPVKVGDVVVPDAAKTGVNIIASRTVLK